MPEGVEYRKAWGGILSGTRIFEEAGPKQMWVLKTFAWTEFFFTGNVLGIYASCTYGSQPFTPTSGGGDRSILSGSPSQSATSKEESSVPSSQEETEPGRITYGYKSGWTWVPWKFKIQNVN